jgi:nucleoside 2-deoxyribosyltransferase
MLGERTGAVLALMREIAAMLAGMGHEILTPHVLDDVLDVDKGVTPEEVYRRDVALLEEADVLVAEVSYPSLGVGFEIAYALLKGKRVIALCEEGRLGRTSALIRGIQHPNFKLLAYRCAEDAKAKLARELERLRAEGAESS